jgi:hypothetical protein
MQSKNICFCNKVNGILYADTGQPEGALRVRWRRAETFARGAYARLKACYRIVNSEIPLRRNRSYCFRKRPLTGRW